MYFILLMKEWASIMEAMHPGVTVLWFDPQLAEPQELLHKHCQHIACSVRVFLASVTGH